MRSKITIRILAILCIPLLSGLLFMRFSCNDKNKDKPIAGFSVVAGYNRNILVGDEVGFTSACIATEPFSVTWFFQGGDPATSTERQVIVKYNTVGSYTVKICVNDTYGMDCVESVGYITVSNSKDIIATGF